jgi:hypothetical protein
MSNAKSDETKVNSDKTTAYLHVVAYYAGISVQPRWNVFQMADQSPRISLAGTVTTYEQARHLAAHDKQPLRISQAAWRQMIEAGVAPSNPPSGITIT